VPWSTEWLAEAKSGTSDFEKILSPLTSEPILNIHVAFTKSPASCVTAPVTEVMMSTTKPEQDLITFGEICNVALRATAEQPGCLGTSWGYSKENPRTVISLVGWASVNAHQRFTKTEVFKISYLPYMQGITESKTIHYKFQQK